MHSKVVKGVEYNLYSDEKEFRKYHPKAKIVEDWRSAVVGQWIKSEDGKVMQIIHRWNMRDTSTPSMKSNDFIRTLLGTASTGKYTKLAGNPAKNIYCFINYKKNSKLTIREKNFAKMVAMGAKPVNAYLNCFKTNDYAYARSRSMALLREKRVKTMVEKEIELLLDDLGISKTYLLEEMKCVVDNKKARDGDKLRALETLMKISGLLNTDKKSESVALIQEFTGFSKDKLKAFEQGLLPESTE
jgi:hypothetical protein